MFASDLTLADEVGVVGCIDAPVLVPQPFDDALPAKCQRCYEGPRWHGSGQVVADPEALEVNEAGAAEADR